MDNMNLNMDLEAPSVAPVPQKSSNKKTIIACVIVALISILGTSAVFLVPSWLKKDEAAPQQQTMNVPEEDKKEDGTNIQVTTHDDAWYKAYYDKFAPYNGVGCSPDLYGDKGLSIAVKTKIALHALDADNTSNIETAHTLEYETFNNMWESLFEDSAPKTDLPDVYCASYTYNAEKNQYEPVDVLGCGCTDPFYNLSKYASHEDTETGFRLIVNKTVAELSETNDRYRVLIQEDGTKTEYDCTNICEEDGEMFNYFNENASKFKAYYMNFKDMGEGRYVLVSVEAK